MSRDQPHIYQVLTSVTVAYVTEKMSIFLSILDIYKQTLQIPTSYSYIIFPKSNLYTYLIETYIFLYKIYQFNISLVFIT